MTQEVEEILTLTEPHWYNASKTLSILFPAIHRWIIDKNASAVQSLLQYMMSKLYYGIELDPKSRGSEEILTIYTGVLGLSVNVPECKGARHQLYTTLYIRLFKGGYETKRINAMLIGRMYDPRIRSYRT